jgi:hypothetical protein
MIALVHATERSVFVEHLPDSKVDCIVPGIPDCWDAINECLYAIGDLPPRYPVPAIPISVSWDRCFALGQLTKIHVLFWTHAGDHVYSSKAIAAE